MAASRRKKKQPKEKFEKALTAVLCGIVAVLVLLAAVISLSEENGGAMPTWQQLYSWFGVAAPVPHLPEEAAGAATKVHFIDVGQGDAVLLEQNGAFALIDAGEREAADGLVAYLQAAGVAKLDLLVMTHPHADHIGGMQAVLDAFPVDKAVLPDFAKAPMPTTSTFLNLLDAIREKQIPTVTARAGDVFPLGEGTLTVLGDGVAAENLNDISLVTLFEAPGLRCLSSGDGEKAVEDAVLASGADVHADVFKAAHHGSSTSNTQAFLDAVRPQAVVVSCGAGNSYGHPHSEALAALTRLAKQGHVEYLTNSMASSPNYPAFSAYSSQRAKFLATGVEIYEYQSTDSIHGKSCVADGRISVVGSFNLDDRSLYIDTESVLIIDSPEFFAQLNAELDTLFAQSAAVGPDNAYLPGSGATALNVSLGKRLLMGFVSIFSRLFRFLI